jgi:hypothetical protein
MNIRVKNCSLLKGDFALLSWLVVWFLFFLFVCLVDWLVGWLVLSFFWSFFGWLAG